MKLKTLKIKEDFLNGTDLGLELFSYFSNKNNCKNPKVLSAQYIVNIIEKTSIFENRKRQFLAETLNKGYKLKNNDINGIVRTSRYETKGFYFVKTFFGELFVDSVVLDDFKFYTDSSSSRVSKRIHRNLLNEFLAYYTNIDELVEQFIFNVNNTKHFSFIENYGDYQMCSLIYQYMERDKGLIKQIDKFEVKDIDKRCMLIQRNDAKILKDLYHTFSVYFSSNFRENSDLFI